MATPNDPVPPKKPEQGTPPAKGQGNPTPKPPTPGKPQSTPPAKEAAGAKPPPGGKPQGSGKPPPSAKRPPVPVKSGSASRTGGRKFGQVLVDLGLIDEDQLWEILDEAKTSGLTTGQVALNRGLITEDQLLQALAEQHGLKVANLEEPKPTADAITKVPETMASVYKVLPLSYKDDVLTVAMGDPNNLAALDDLRNLLGVKEVLATLAQPKAI